MKSNHLTRKLLRPLLVFTLGLGGISLASATQYQVIQNFDCNSGACGPSGPLTLDQNSNLYGTAYGGGSNAEGAVFELTRNPDGTWTQTVLHSFDFGVDGESPRFGVALDDAGNLYGTTFTGGPKDAGTVFRLTPSGGGWTINLLYNLGAAGGIVLDNPGNVYTPLGPGDYIGGAVAELSPGPNGWTYTALYSFCAHKPQCWDGILPQGLLVWDAAGNLYGTTPQGGIRPPQCGQQLGCGVVFQMKHGRDGTWIYHVLYRFGSFPGDAQVPNGGVLVDSAGSVYGTTLYGGPNYLQGTLFKLSPHPPGQWGQSTGYTETILYAFPDCATGCAPYAPLAMDKAGNLYGVSGGGNTSCGGGGYYCGVVYRLAPQPDGTWKYSVVHKFAGPDGDSPNGVTVAPDGTIYGTTLTGGQYNLGVAFAITP